MADETRLMLTDEECDRLSREAWGHEGPAPKATKRMLRAAFARGVAAGQEGRKSLAQEIREGLRVRKLWAPTRPSDLITAIFKAIDEARAAGRAAQRKRDRELLATIWALVPDKVSTKYGSLDELAAAIEKESANE